MTVLAAFMVTVQVLPEAVSQPLQPMNMDKGPGVAVRVTIVPLLYVAEHVGPQLIPEGLDVTVPPMMPVLLTVRVKRCTAKVAVTDRAALMATVQVVPETASQPLQPVNVDPVAGVAVRVTTVPLL